MQYILRIARCRILGLTRPVPRGSGSSTGRSDHWPDQDDVEASAAAVAHHLVEARPHGFVVGDRVRVFLDDLRAALGGHLLETVKLCLRVLIDGAYSHIKDGTFQQNQVGDLVEGDLHRVDRGPRPINILQDSALFDSRGCSFHGVLEHGRMQSAGRPGRRKPRLFARRRVARVQSPRRFIVAVSDHQDIVI